MNDKDLLTGPQAEEWFKEFAQQSNILTTLDCQVEFLTTLLNKELSHRFSNARTFIYSYLPFGDDWLNEILNGKTPNPFSEKEREELSNYLLDRAVATDALVKVPDSQGTIKVIAVDITTNFEEETEKLCRIEGKSDPGDRPGYNRNRNLPKVRKTLNIDKHLVLVLNNNRQLLPSYEKLKGDLEEFCSKDTVTESLNLREIPENLRFKWNKQKPVELRFIDPKQMWSKYSRVVQNKEKSEASKQASLCAIRAGYKREEVLEMLKHDPQYKLLAKNKPDIANNYLMMVYTSAREQFELDKSKNPTQQDVNIQTLKASRYIVHAVGMEKPNGERMVAGKLLTIRQKGSDLTIESTADQRTVLEYQSGTLKGNPTATELQWLRGWANAIQSDKQRNEQRNKDTGLER